MRTGFKMGIISFLTLVALRAQAGETLIWTNGSGITTADNCQAESVSTAQVQTLGAEMNERLSKTNEVNAYLTFPGTSAVLTQSFWAAARNDGGALTALNCETENGSRTYIAFAVYEPQSIAPFALVGVSAEETGIFQYEPLKVHSTVQTTKAPLELPAGVTVTEGSPTNVVCISSGKLNVRDESLERVLYSVDPRTVVKVFQSFGERPEKTISGTTYSFVKVQFADRKESESTGWIPAQYVKSETECASPAPKPLVATATSTWVFPTIARPTDSYLEGMRRFNASRSGGKRSHAACDLYRVKDEAAVAVTSGTIIRDRYYFYEGTYAIDIKHTGGKIARYGEITGKKAGSLKLNSSVKAGQTVGYIGKVNSNCCKPMLHFELYSGTASGSLSQSGNKYGRRKDLIDPTKLLRELEKSTFGKSY